MRLHAEKQLEPGDAILTHAPADIVHARIEQFLSFVAEAAGPFRDQRHYAAQAQEVVAGRAMGTERKIQYAIAVADYCLFDEMRPDSFSKARLRADYAWTDLGAPYQRFYMYNCWFPDDVVEAVKTHGEAELTHLAIGFPQHILHRYNGVGQVGMLTPEFAYWANSPRLRPPLGVCRQQLFAALLRCGINPFAGCKVSNTARRMRSEKRPFYLRKYRKLARLSARATMDDLERFEARTAQHWGALMGEAEHGVGESALLFNSGTAANESVIAAVAEASLGPQYTHPFWYFENQLSIERLFPQHTASEPSRAHIVFLNLEPVTLHNRFAGKTWVQPQTVIQDFVKRAQAHVSTRHVLVVDVTLDPVFSVTDILQERLPENVCVIKTASATKHQRSGRNYFFGAVTVLNESPEGASLQALIVQKRSLLGGELSPWHRLHCPRPSAAWLREKRRRVAALNRSLIDVIPAGSGWRFLPFSYSSFLLPPVAMQQALKDHLGCLREGTDAPTFNRLIWRIGRTLGASLVDGHHDTGFPGIETGNSFGLSMSRILLEEADTDTDEDMGRFGVRISPGYATDQAALQAYVREMFERFRKAIHDLLSSQRLRLYELALAMSNGNRIRE